MSSSALQPGSTRPGRSLGRARPVQSQWRVKAKGGSLSKEPGSLNFLAALQSIWPDPPKIHKIIGNSRFYYINGLRDLFVQIDMVLTFHFRQGLPRKCLYISPENHPRVGALRAPNSGWILGAFIKTF